MIAKNKVVLLLTVAVVFIQFGCNKNADLDDFKPPIPDQSEIQNIPLNDPDEFVFEGLNSGLFPWGNTLINNQYNTDYINVCKSLGDLSLIENPEEKEPIVILTLGPSNPHKIFEGIKYAQMEDPGFGENIRYVNGAIGGIDFNDILNPAGPYWTQVDSTLQSQNISASQVQVIFCIEDDLLNQDTTILRAYQLKENYINLLEEIRSKFPNCILFLAGDKGYNNYSSEERFAEPKGYLNGWAIKLLLEDYINGYMADYPFIYWLDYYWANGITPRWDGLTYALSDFNAPDYIHLTTEKANELGRATHEKLKSDPGARYWYK